MSTKPKILLTSAAGNNCIPTTLQLVEKGFPVRAFGRRNDHRAKQLKDVGTESSLEINIRSPICVT